MEMASWKRTEVLRYCRNALELFRERVEDREEDAAVAVENVLGEVGEALDFDASDEGSEIRAQETGAPVKTVDANREKAQFEATLRQSIHVEYETWRELCAVLVETGVVTKDDCQSPVGNNATSGQRVFNAIRAWGEALRRLDVAKANVVAMRLRHE